MGDVRIRVRQRKNGQNVYEYSFEGLPIDGKRNIISKSGFKTKKEAKAAGQEEKEKYEKLGQITKIKEMSYSDFLDEWLKKDCVHCKRTTIQGYIKRINLYIKPQIGYKKLTTINRDDIQELMTNMYNDGFSINTIVCVRGILSKSFDYAIIERIIPFSPVMRITIPTNDNPKNQTRENPHAYIPEDIMIKIFKRFPEGTTAYIPLMIAYHTGLRLGEVYALTWNDIDLKNKTLSVNRQVQWQAGTKTKEEINKTKSQKSDGFWYFSTPKYDSYRTIDIDDELTEILLNERNKQRSFKKIYGDNYYKYYCEQALTYNGHKPKNYVLAVNKIGEKDFKNEVNFVCRQENGYYVTARTTQNITRVVKNGIKFDDFDFHSLRHTHGMMLYENGADWIYIQRRLGHKDLDTTINIYTSHYTPKIHYNGAVKLNDIYSIKAKCI